MGVAHLDLSPPVGAWGAADLAVLVLAPAPETPVGVAGAGAVGGAGELGSDRSNGAGIAGVCIRVTVGIRIAVCIGVAVCVRVAVCICIAVCVRLLGGGVAVTRRAAGLQGEAAVSARRKENEEEDHVQLVVFAVSELL